MVQLLGRRGEHCSNMATSLMKQLEQKMKASNLTTSEVLQLSQHLEESGLPEGCRDDLLAQCDQLAMQGSHQSAVKLSQQQQSCDNLTNFLTAGDWKGSQAAALLAKCQHFDCEIEEDWITEFE